MCAANSDTGAADVRVVAAAASASVRYALKTVGSAGAG